MAAIKTPINVGYVPQPKQLALHKCRGNEILYGGAAGPGKSMSLRMEALMWAVRIRGLQIYLFRRTFPELEDNHILPSLQQYPIKLAKFVRQHHRWEFFNLSMIHFGHVQYDQDVFRYQGAEIHLLLIDELTTFTEFQFDYLRARVRCALDIPDKYRHKIPGIICASNPGGIGHSFVKRRWVDFAQPLELKRAPNNEGGMLRCYIPGLLEDNTVLMERDPSYIHRLDALPEPYRTAYKTGDWDIFIGQAFNFNYQRHVIKPLPIPETAPLYFTFDWGFAKPFCCLWFWPDQDGRLYLCQEWYGSTGQPDTGVRLTDNEIAEGIREREKRWGFDNRRITRYCDPTCFNKKPDYLGGGQGPSTSEVLSRFGVNMIPGDASRRLKIRQFHQRLMVPPDGTMPMLVVYDNCVEFIRTIPLLQMDPHNAEDVDTNGEDHSYDSACHAMMARPISMPMPTVKQSLEDKRIERLIRGETDGYERMVLDEEHMTQEYLTHDFGASDHDGYSDGDY